MPVPDPSAAPPGLSGDRVRLRPLRRDDVALVEAAGRDPFIPALTTVPAGADRGAALSYLERVCARRDADLLHPFAVEPLEGDGPVGVVSVRTDLPPGRASIGYWVLADHRRRGYAADALRTAVGWAWAARPDLARLELYVEPWNTGSCTTAERAGFEREGLLRSWQEVGGVRRDMLMYALLRPAA